MVARFCCSADPVSGPCRSRNRAIAVYADRKDSGVPVMQNTAFVTLLDEMSGALL
jgi:hypothetical protein